MTSRVVRIFLAFFLVSTVAQSQELLVAPADSTKESRAKDLWRCLALAQGQLAREQSYSILAIWDDIKKHVLGERPTGGFIYTTMLSSRSSPVANDDGYPARRDTIFGASASNEISDRYVICLFASGYRWKDSAKPYFEEIRELASKGTAAAQAELAMLNFSGRQGTGRADYTEFANWMRKAAESGYGVAQFNLAYAYAFGDGVARNDEETLRWMRKAAESGYARATPILQRVDRALQDIRARREDIRDLDADIAGAEQGDSRAQFRMATRYEDGRGVERDMNTAISWYRKSAESGHRDAQGYLGVIHDKGRGIKQDDAEAARWYRVAADKGDPQSQYNLGVFYFQGRGVNQDKVEAKKWFERARDSKYPAAAGTLKELF